MEPGWTGSKRVGRTPRTGRPPQPPGGRPVELEAGVSVEPEWGIEEEHSNA